MYSGVHAERLSFPDISTPASDKQLCISARISPKCDKKGAMNNEPSSPFQFGNRLPSKRKLERLVKSPECFRSNQRNVCSHQPGSQ